MKEANHRVNLAHKLNRKSNTEATRGLLRAAICIAKATADRVQEEQWLAWCASLDASVTTTVLWRKIRAVVRGALARRALHPRPQEEAERLVDAFASSAVTD